MTVSTARSHRRRVILALRPHNVTNADNSELAEQLQQEEEDEISQLGKSLILHSRRSRKGSLPFPCLTNATPCQPPLHAAAAYDDYSSGIAALRADGEQAQLDDDALEAALCAYESGNYVDSALSSMSVGCRTPMAPTAAAGGRASSGGRTQQGQTELRATDVRCPLCNSAQLYEDRVGSVVACPSAACALHTGLSTGASPTKQRVPSPPSSETHPHRMAQGWEVAYAQRIEAHAAACSGSLLYQLQARVGSAEDKVEGMPGNKSSLYMHCLDCGLSAALIG